MELNEVIELMSTVDSMESIEEVAVTFGDNPSVTIKKKTQAKVATPKALTPEQGFHSAQTFAPKPQGNQATAGQIKFALDLATKIGDGNMSSVVNGLAHALETVEGEILHPDKWAEEMTRDHASQYIDVLESQYKKMQKQKGAWG